MEGADMEQLLVWVKKLAVFMILCSYMEHLRRHNTSDIFICVPALS